MRLSAVGVALSLLLSVLSPAPSGAAACPPPSSTLLFHSCWGDARIRLLALPEDLPLPAPPETGRQLVVTGAYTGRESRVSGAPKPVGLFLSRGRVINRNLGRMDGVLLMWPGGGGAQLFSRHAVEFDGEVFDLTDISRRRAFVVEAARRRLSVMQSHLLVYEGRLDVRDREGAPRSVRRLLFFDELGFGVYQTMWPMTLYEAAREVVAAVEAEAVLNLDMGTYDFCRLTVDGVERDCGRVGEGEMGKLSNLLVLELR